ncbi:MAG: pyridoxamine 5'-phosphate oxidase family protein [Chloroflexota bacterium]
MAKLPEKASKAWDDRQGPIVLATVDENGVPNAVYAGAVSKYDEETIVIADNYFDKTRENILSGSKASVLFMTNEIRSFQLKGTITYHWDGELFDHMRKWNPEGFPGRAAAALKVEEVYSGAERLV